MVKQSFSVCLCLRVHGNVLAWAMKPLSSQVEILLLALLVDGIEFCDRNVLRFVDMVFGSP